MSINTCCRRHLSGVLLVLALALPCGADVAATDTILDLGTFGGNESRAFGINASGAVVGWSTTAILGDSHGFIYSANTMDDIEPNGLHHVDVRGINNSNQVAGFGEAPGIITYHAFLNSNHTRVDLGTLGGTGSFGLAVNDNGQVTGWSDTMGDAEGHAFLYSGGNLIDLPTLGGSRTEGHGINNNGQITGFSYLPGDMGQQAFLYSGGMLAPIPTLGGPISQGDAINDSGQVVGWSYTNMPGTKHAFRYSGGNLEEISPLGGQNCEATAINNHGDVVGMSDAAGGGRTVFLFAAGHVFDVKAFLPPNSGWHLTDVTGINDNGWICGTGVHNGETRAFLIIPNAYTIKGRVNLDGVNHLESLSPGAPFPGLHLQFRKPGTNTEIFRTDVPVTPVGGGSPYGAFQFLGPVGQYDVVLKSDKGLRVLLPGVTVGATLNLPDVSLPGGDANDDNHVDIGDFGILVGVYGASYSDPDSGYDARADFNYDGVIDVADFSLLVNEYGNTGAP